MKDHKLCAVPAHRTLADCVSTMAETREPSTTAPTDLAAEVPCLYARVTHRIIRLRRGTHGDWELFRSEVEDNLDAILRDLDSAWLISICDMFADYADPVEQRNALCVSVLFNWEKHALTQRVLHGSLHARDADPYTLDALQNPLPLWDGVTAIMTKPSADLLPDMFGRVAKLVSETPVVDGILKTLYRRMKTNPHSTLAALNCNHRRDLFDDVERALAAYPAVASRAHAQPFDEQGRNLEDRITRIEAAIHDLSAELSTFTKREFADRETADHSAPRSDTGVDQQVVEPATSAAELVEQGEQLYASGKRVQAGQRFIQALKIAPRHVDALNNLGVILAEQGQTDAATQCFDAVLELDSECAAARDNLASLSNEDDAVAQAGVRDTAASAHGDMHPGTRNWQREGELYFDAGDFDAAHTCFERALQQSPHDTECLNDMGVCLWAKGDAAQGLMFFGKGLEYAPDDRNLVLNAGHVLAENGRTSDAVALYQSYLEDFACDPEIEHRLRTLTEGDTSPEAAATASGEACFARGDMDGARRAFEHALELSPGHVDALNNLGVLSWQAGNRAQTLTYLRRAMERDPAHPDTLRNLVVVLQEMGEHETAGLLADASDRRAVGN